MSRANSTPGSSASGICVAGGGNGWGKRIAEALAAGGAEVRIIEKDDGQAAAAQAIAASAAVFIAMPDPAIDGFLQAHRMQLAHKAVLDCATNKTGFSARLQLLAQAGASVCSTHPMAASNGLLRGQNALLMPLGENAAAAEAIARQLFERLGMRCRQVPFAQHTELMAVVQMLPHAIQRLFIDALGQGLSGLGIGIDELDGLASANYLLAELGLGRVAAQRASVSAGIVETALREPFGQELLDTLRKGLQQLRQAGHSRAELEVLFETGTQRLDPDGSWRRDMAVKSEAALVRLGNLRSRALGIEAPNRIGMLRDILIVLARHGIDMTALDSQLHAADDGKQRVRFEIAISNDDVPHDAVALELAQIGAQLVRLSGR